MATTKNAVFIGLQLENCYLVGGGINLWWGGSNKNLVVGSLLAGNFCRWGE